MTMMKLVLLQPVMLAMAMLSTGDYTLVTGAVVLGGAGLCGAIVALVHVVGVPQLFSLRSSASRTARHDALDAPALRLFDRIDEFQ